MANQVQEAQERFDKADRLFKGGLICFGVVTLIILSLSLFKIYSIGDQIKTNQSANAAASQKRFERYVAENEQQHKLTQQYIRCIAQVLLLPLEERTDAAFDKCSRTGEKITANTKTKTTSNSVPKVAVTRTTAPIVTQSKPKTEDPQTGQTTTSEPPKPVQGGGGDAQDLLTIGVPGLLMIGVQ